MDDEQRCREAFNAWYVCPDGNSRALRRSDTNPDGYHLMQVQLSWTAWKAAWNTRPAPVVTDELIEIAAAAWFERKGGMIENWRAALEAALKGRG